MAGVTKMASSVPPKTRTSALPRDIPVHSVIGMMAPDTAASMIQIRWISAGSTPASSRRSGRPQRTGPHGVGATERKIHGLRRTRCHRDITGIELRAEAASVRGGMKAVMCRLLVAVEQRGYQRAVGGLAKVER